MFERNSFSNKDNHNANNMNGKNVNKNSTTNTIQFQEK